MNSVGITLVHLKIKLKICRNGFIVNIRFRRTGRSWKTTDHGLGQRSRRLAMASPEQRWWLPDNGIYSSEEGERQPILGERDSRSSNPDERHCARLDRRTRIRVPRDCSERCWTI